jgi:hypothetical protein
MVAEIFHGTTYPLHVSVWSNDLYTQYVYAFFDWNQDLDFYDEGEAYYLGSGVNPDLYLNITIPFDALNGPTRMRILEQYVDNGDPCASAVYGEVEDYTVSTPPGLPVFSVNPAEITGVANIGGSDEQPLMVENYGSGTLYFSAEVTIDPALMALWQNWDTNEASIPNTEITDLAPDYQPGLPNVDAFSDLLTFIDVETPTGDNRCLGVQYVDNGIHDPYFWVTGAMDMTVEYFHSFDATGTYIGSHIQDGSAPGWGFRDMCVDDAGFMYCSDSGMLQQFDISGGPTVQPVNTGVMIPSPVSPTRTLAYRTVTGTFWTADYGPTIYEFLPDGTIVNTYINLYSFIYGLAYDEVGDFIWIHDGTGGMDFYQWDAATGTPTGLSFTGAIPPGINNAFAGGVDYVTEFDFEGTIYPVLAALGKGDPFDFIGIYDVTPPVPSWLSIDIYEGNIPPGGAPIVITVTMDASELNGGIYYGSINFTTNDPDNLFVPVPVELIVTDVGIECDYTLADINSSGWLNGIDVTYGVAYFKGGPPPPYSCECTPDSTWYVAGDANGSCSFNGLDINYLVSYFKGGPLPLPCPDCPPAP